MALIASTYVAFAVGAQAQQDPLPGSTMATEVALTSTAQNAGTRCRSARKALAYYRLRHSTWLELRGVHAEPRISQPYGCGHVRWLVGKWKKRSYQARMAYYRWRDDRFRLKDYPYNGRSDPWPRAIVEAQRPYPGTGSWLFSCSDAEGWGPGLTRWIGYGGVNYSTWLRDSDTVGGPMQFRWSTFKGMYRHALDDLRSRGYKVPTHLRDPGNDITWRSALGQALAAGWARYTGNDNSHWSASWGNGC